MRLESFKYFYPEKPFLITKDQPLFRELSISTNWVAEKKYNGSRLQLHHLDEFQFWNRHGDRFRYTPPKEILHSLKKLQLTGYCLFDGELRHNKVTGVHDKIILFDVFIWQNEFLHAMPFAERRLLLEKLFPVEAEPIGIPRQYSTDFPAVFTTVTQDKEIEGLVMKNINGKLNLGRTKGSDSNWMFKVRKPSSSYKF